MYDFARGFVEGDIFGVARGCGDVVHEAAGERDGGREVAETDDVPGCRLVFLVVAAEIGVGVRLDEELAAGVPEVDAVVAGDVQVVQEVYHSGEVLWARVGHVAGEVVEG